MSSADAYGGRVPPIDRLRRQGAWPRRAASTRGGWSRRRRRSAWWSFFGYLTFRAFNATHVWYAPYISPTVAPPLFTPAAGYPGAVPVEHAWFGAFPAWWPAFLPQSPAFFIPGLAIAFRLTCYYYRGAYYKAFFLSPPSCAVGGVPRRYRGETALLAVPEPPPLHAVRRAVPARVPLVGGLAAFFRDGRFGIGVGTVVMVVNAALLTRLHVRLPFVAPPDRRPARLLLVRRARLARYTAVEGSSGSTSGTWRSPGAAWSGSRSPTSTSTCCPRAR